jgi:ElaB/YqjD/DUF883 family membrane-anchored ribosome-binding protein
MRDRAADGANEATERAKRLMDTARDTAERAGSYAQASVSRLSDRAQDVAGELMQDARAGMERFTGRDLDAWSADLRRFVQERPLQAILVTVAIGYVLGKILKRG